MKNFILLFLAIFTLGSCSKDRDDETTNNSIVGVWNNSAEEVYQYTFTKEGRFYTKVKNGGDITEVDKGTYNYDGTTLKTKFIDYYQNGSPVMAIDEQACKIEGNKMTLGGKDEYTRQ